MNLSPEQLRYLQAVIDRSAPETILRRMKRPVTPKTLAHLGGVLADFVEMGCLELDGDWFRLTDMGQQAIAG